MKVQGVTPYWRLQIGGWALFGLTHISIDAILNNLTPSTMARHLFLMSVCFLFSHLLKITIQWFHVFSRSIKKQLPYLCALISLYVVGASFVQTFFEIISQVPTPNAGKRTDFHILLIVNFAVCSFLFCMWTYFYFIFHHIKGRKKKMDMLQLEIMVKDLELTALRKKIKLPLHSLDNIKLLIQKDPIEARNAITEICNLFRSKPDY